MKNLLFLTFILMGSLSAQSFNGRINPVPNNKTDAPDSVKILAVMVEFQADKDNATVGDGTFNSIYEKDWGTDILDPLPHDSAYFANHLLFAKNYFEKVSGGKLGVSFNVVNKVFTTENTMRGYSPDQQGEDLSPLGNLAQEIWTTVDADNSIDINFADYDLFVIFHAGVGREFSIPGDVGTRRDLPSLYLGASVLEEIFGAGFDGFPVDGGAFNINNTLIMPQTESRETTSFGETSLIELTINGLLCASIGSHLGLPDLYNTETGQSAIGRFGLMDPQAFFAYRGSFLPEPSAWEKMYLGWIEPTEVPVTDAVYTISNEVTALPGDNIYLKIPINVNEYFLIENRKRDPLNNGSTVTYIQNGQTKSKSFINDDEGYYSFSTDSVDGIVIDVDHYDWALPGLDTLERDVLEDIGFIIWHIDESVINEKYSSNTINNDRSRMGVKVVEADGVFDIGEEFETILGTTEIGEGTKLDTWYSTNQSDLYKNEFTPDSRPNTNSNSGANSLINITEISGISNEMSFRLSYGSNVIKPVTYKKLDLDSPVEYFNILKTDEEFEYLAVTENNIYLLGQNGEVKRTFNGIGGVQPLAYYENNRKFFAAAKGDVVYYYYNDGFYEIYDSIDLSSFSINAEFLTPSVQFDSTSGNELTFKIGCNDTRLRTFEMPFTGAAPSLTYVDEINRGVSKIDHYFYSFSHNMEAVIDSNEYNTINTATNNIIKFGKVSGKVLFGGFGNFKNEGTLILLSEGNNFTVIPEQSGNISFKIESGSPINKFSIGNLKDNGSSQIAFANGNKLEAYNLSGSSVDNFPFILKNGDQFTSSPLIADIDGDEIGDIVAFTSSGNIYGISGLTGEVLPGYPVSTGSETSIVPVFDMNSTTGTGYLKLASVSSDNFFSLFSLGTELSNIYWSGLYGSPGNSSVKLLSGNSNNISEYFPNDKAYNWPNPVYGNETNIRYYVSESSSVTIRIFDLGGELVDELKDSAEGGFENETVWNVSNIQSGVYLCSIEVSSNSSKSASKLIKIAVIK